MSRFINNFMNNRGSKGRYGIQNPDQSSHHDSEEARQASVQHFYVEGNQESYMLGTTTRIYEHVAAAPPVVTEYSNGIQHVQRYGSPVQDRDPASPLKNYGATKPDYRLGSLPKKDGFQHVRPPQVTDSRFSYLKSEAMPNKNDDGVDVLYHKPPLTSVDQDTQLHEFRPPNSRMNSPVYENLQHEKPRPFSPNFQTRPTQLPNVAAPPSRPIYYHEHNSSVDNPVFNMLLGLYLEKREGTNNPKAINSMKGDYRRSNYPLGKPTDNNIGSAINFPTQVANKQTQFPGPGMEGGAKQQDKYLPLHPNTGDDSYERSNRPFIKPIDYKLPNIPAGATNQAKFPGPDKFPGPGKLQGPGMDKYSQPPNSGENFSTTFDNKEVVKKNHNGFAENNKIKYDNEISSRPLTKPTDNIGTAKNMLTEGYNIANNPKKQSFIKGLGAESGKYASSVRNFGENISRTFDSKEIVKENHNGLAENNRIKYDNEISGRPLTKPTDDIGTTKNMFPEGNNIANVPAAAKKQSFIKGLGSHSGKYSPLVANLGEKVSRTFDSKEANVDENPKGFMENNRIKYDDKISGRSLTKSLSDIGTATNHMLTEGSNFANVPAATKKVQQFMGLGVEGAAKKPGKYSPPVTDSGEENLENLEIIGSEEALERYNGAFVP